MYRASVRSVADHERQCHLASPHTDNQEDLRTVDRNTDSNNLLLALRFRLGEFQFETRCQEQIAGNMPAPNLTRRRELTKDLSFSMTFAQFVTPAVPRRQAQQVSASQLRDRFFSRLALSDRVFTGGVSSSNPSLSR